jgi:hypothetical protein
MQPDSTALDGWVVRYYGNIAAISACTSCEVAAFTPIDSVIALEEAHEDVKHSGSDFARHVGRSIMAGTGVGAGLAALILGSRLLHPCTSEDCQLDTPLAAVALPIVGGGIGLLLGVISGAVGGEPLWTPVRRI